MATYRRIVNHELHNLDFFYALLVTARRQGRSGLGRYAVRHYVLFRGDDRVYEVRPADVRITDEAKIWPRDVAEAEERPHLDRGRRDRAGAVRAHDQQVLGAMFPSLKPRLSARSETFFWKGAAAAGRRNGGGATRSGGQRRRDACLLPEGDTGLGGGR